MPLKTRAEIEAIVDAEHFGVLLRSVASIAEKNVGKSDEEGGEIIQKHIAEMCRAKNTSFSPTDFADAAFYVRTGLYFNIPEEQLNRCIELITQKQFVQKAVLIISMQSIAAHSVYGHDSEAFNSECIKEFKSYPDHAIVLCKFQPAIDAGVAAVMAVFASAEALMHAIGNPLDLDRPGILNTVLSQNTDTMLDGELYKILIDTTHEMCRPTEARKKNA